MGSPPTRRTLSLGTGQGETKLHGTTPTATGGKRAAGIRQRPTGRGVARFVYWRAPASLSREVREREGRGGERVVLTWTL